MDMKNMGRLDLKYWRSFHILVALLLGCSTLGVCNGRTMYHGGGRNRFLSTTSASFNVLDFGAKGDGKKDDTEAFQAAWAKACSTAGSTMLVPLGSTFLLGPITFLGQNCVPNMVFQLEGTVVAPTSSAAWGTDAWNWLEFKQVQGFTIQGKGVIDGRGTVWWNKDEMPSTKPTALRVYGSNKVTVTGVQIRNSPLAHLKFDACTQVRVFHISISSPADSPNTDGIHLQNSQDVLIYDTTIGSGDDCVSIQTGCSGVYIHDVNCGPGHGFSIGGLGNDHTKACVSNITVRDVKLYDTLAGARIKTWQGGSGAVQNALFSNIQVTGVKIPIMIDQFYCDKSSSSQCANETSAVAVSGITFENIRGTYTHQPAHLACSDSVPCEGITLNSIDLTPAQGNDLTQSFCWNAYGEVATTSNPPIISCLKPNKQSSKTLNSRTEAC